MAFSTPFYSPPIFNKQAPALQRYDQSTTRAPGTPDYNPVDYGVYDVATGKVKSLLTGQPWTGKEPRSGKMFSNGVEAAAPPASGVEVPYGGGQTINPNSADRYKPIDIIKDQPIADASANLLETFKKSANDSLKGFDDYLSQFKADTSAALERSRNAVDITPTVNRLNQTQSTYENSLNASTAAQAAELEKAKRDYADLNAANAATQRGIVQKGYNELPAYDAAGNAIADRQLQEVVKNLSRYKLGTGTPSSLGSDESAILARGAADVMLPLKQAQIGKRYDLYGNEANVERGIYGTEQNRVAQFNPEIAAREFAASQGTAQQEFQSGQVTANTIQALKERAANMSYEQAIKFFNLLGVPEQIKQQILSGQIQQLGQLANLNEVSRYRGLSDVLGANLSTPQYSGFNAPGFPSAPRYNPAPVQSLRAPNSPATVAPTRTGTNPAGRGGVGELVADPSGNGFWDADGNFYAANEVGAGNPYGRYSGNFGPTPTTPSYLPSYTGDVNLPENMYA